LKLLEILVGGNLFKGLIGFFLILKVDDFLKSN
jgi:hypothetical protein